LADLVAVVAVAAVQAAVGKITTCSIFLLIFPPLMFYS